MWKLILGVIITSLLFSCKKKEGESIETHQINPTFSTLTDIEGNEYKTVVLDGQEWIAENLRTSTYCNGDSIPYVVSDSQWIELEYGGWSFYENDSSYNKPFGKIYNFHAVEDERNICPCGWRVPNKEDWNKLITYLGGDIVAGGKLKSTGTEYWQAPNHAATNESSFNALPTGSRSHVDGQYSEPNLFAAFWSDDYTYYGSFPISSLYRLDYDRGSINKFSGLMQSGFAVRCVKE